MVRCSAPLPAKAYYRKSGFLEASVAVDLFSPKHLLIVLLVVLVVFGTKKLRTIGSDLGQAVRGFKDSMKEGERDAETAAPRRSRPARSPAQDRDEPRRNVPKRPKYSREDLGLSLGPDAGAPHGAVLVAPQRCRHGAPRFPCSRHALPRRCRLVGWRRLAAGRSCRICSGTVARFPSRARQCRPAPVGPAGTAAATARSRIITLAGG